MLKELILGESDFKKLMEKTNPSEENYFFVDKSLLIKEVLYDPYKVIVLPRPRRFGKTLNLSMLRYFFDSSQTKEEVTKLFSGLDIAKDLKCMEEKAKCPVVFVTFKKQKHANMELLEEGFGRIIANLFSSYEYLLGSDKLSDRQKNSFKEILAEKSNRTHLEISLE